MTTPKIIARMCYLCYIDGELVLAIACYELPTGDECDVCAKHLEIVKKQGFSYRSIEEENVIER